MNSRASRVLVNLHFLRSNYRSLKALSSSSFFCPMVKANAYGHGMIPVVRALQEEGCRQVGVALVEEAVQLRSAGLDKIQILIFGPLSVRDVDTLFAENLTPVVSRLEDLQLLGRALGRQTLPIHVKFNSGMNRLGFALRDAEAVKKFLQQHAQFELQGVCTHLLQGSDAAQRDGFTKRQITLFREVSQLFGGVDIHVHNSSSLIAHWSHGLNSELELGARPGIALYGSLPEVDVVDGKARSLLQGLKLYPVLALESEVVRIHELEAGEVVSYGARWKATRNARIAVIPIGYGDGYPRLLTNRAQVLVNGRRCAIVGTVTMDYIMADITGQDAVRVGDQVVVVGDSGKESITAKELADLVDTIDYEILTRLGSRLPRIYL